MHIVLDIPDSIAGFMPPGKNPERAALEALALEGYRSQRLGESALRRLLGFESRIQVHGFLKEHGVYLPCTMDDIERDTETALRTALMVRADREARAEPQG